MRHRLGRLAGGAAVLSLLAGPSLSFIVVHSVTGAGVGPPSNQVEAVVP